MKHFVINDIDPVKASDLALFLKEMNDLAVLISVAEAPLVSADDLTYNDDYTTCQLKVSEGFFEALFKAQLLDNKIVNGQFDLFEDGKTIASVFHSVRDDQPIDLRVKLNCEGEDLAKSELIDNFERDFSYEAHQDMNKSLEELREKEIDKNVLEKPESDKEEVVHVDELEMVEEESEGENCEEEILELSEKVRNSLNDAKVLLDDLSALCYDLTRGKTVLFADKPLKMETLDNGAQVEFLDLESNGYQITFRRGSLGGLSEISFYLEKEGELIFNLYFSSTGEGKIVVGNSQSEIIAKRVKDRIL